MTPPVFNESKSLNDPDARDEGNLLKSLVQSFALEISQRRCLRVFDLVAFCNFDFRQCQPNLLTFIVGCFYVSIAA